MTDLDLAAIRARFELARMAGIAAVDSEEGWDEARINALIRSWRDVSVLHDAYKRLLEQHPTKG